MSAGLTSFVRHPWPKMSPRAYHGVLGKIVRTIAPHTEADPAGILVSMLVAAGNCIGRTPSFRVERDRHGVNLYAVIVANSSKGRKGVGYGCVRELFGKVDPDWLSQCVTGGLSTGEGLISVIADPPLGDDGLPTGPTPDRRLLVREGEYARILAVMARDGSVLSHVVRDAWDGVDLMVKTRKEPLRASDPHVSILAHVTEDELVRSLTATDAANGFANRFLFTCARRARLLSRGGSLPDADLLVFVDALREAVDLARRTTTLDRDGETWDAWGRSHRILSAERPGLLGSLTARAEAMVTRLSGLYALLDCSAVVKLEHLAAAISVWRYCAHSVRYVFGDALGDPAADTILVALRQSPEGLTRTGVHALFARNRNSADVGRALGELLRRGLVTVIPRRRRRSSMRPPRGDFAPALAWFRERYPGEVPQWALLLCVPDRAVLPRRSRRLARGRVRVCAARREVRGAALAESHRSPGRRRAALRSLALGAWGLRPEA